LKTPSSGQWTSWSTIDSQYWRLLLPPVAAGALLLTGWSLNWAWFGAFVRSGAVADWATVVGTIFVGIVLEALPLLLLGVLVSAALHTWVSDAMLCRLLPQGRILGAVVGSLLGLVMPVCECGAVAISRRLLQLQAPAPLALSFMLAAPVVNPVVMTSTWVAFGGDPVIWLSRFGLVLFIATVVGLGFGLHPRPASLLTSGAGQACSCASQPSTTPSMTPLTRIVTSATTEMFAMGKYLVFGAFTAAVLQATVPRTVFTDLGDAGAFSVLALMTLAAILSICSTVDAFVVLSFTPVFEPAAILGFLVLGPLVNLKSSAMYGSVLQPRAVLLLVVVCFQLAFLGAMLVQWMIG
jgi:hypothetical protein